MPQQAVEGSYHARRVASGWRSAETFRCGARIRRGNTCPILQQNAARRLRRLQAACGRTPCRSGDPLSRQSATGRGLRLPDQSRPARLG
jgi:hypothetical protein